MKHSAFSLCAVEDGLDVPHVVEKLRIAGRRHYTHTPAAEEYGRERTLLLLEGKVDDVIEDFEAALEDQTLRSEKAEELRIKALGYFQNHRARRAYDQYLAKGLPIDAGIIESACNCLINIRIQGPGMSWSADGAEAILKLRGVCLDEFWDDFSSFRAKKDCQRLYARYDNVRELDCNNPAMARAARWRSRTETRCALRCQEKASAIVSIAYHLALVCELSKMGLT